MKISIFADEINREDPERAIALAAVWGVTHVEVRSLPGGRFPAVADAELADFYARVCDAGLKVSAVSPGFFKCAVDDAAVDKGLSEGLPRACEWAQRWGTDLVSCFGFRRGDATRVPVEVIDRLGEMADIAARGGCRLVLENEAVCWGDTGVEAAEALRQVGTDRMTLCWDPGNSARAGSACPFPDEYDQLKDLVTHLHVKNYVPDTGEWEVAEQGIVDWPGQFQALRADGYDGFAVVETHLRTRSEALGAADPNLSGLEANTHRNLEFVRSCLGV